MDLTKTREIATEIIREAGEVAKKYFVSGVFTSHSKSEIDFATQADLEVDAFLKEKLQTAFPKTKFLTEESAPKDFSSLQDATDLWIIDPIDGTTNFSRRDDHWAISVGLVDKGICKLGLVYLPVEEGGKFYYAQADKSEAFCNDKIIHVSDRSDLKTASIGLDWGWASEDRKKTLVWLEKVVFRIRQPRSLGSAASDLCMVAEGKLDGYVDAGLNPWDVAGGSLILQKAGGEITTPKGEVWNVFLRDIVSTNARIHEEVLHLLN